MGHLTLYPIPFEMLRVRKKHASNKEKRVYQKTNSVLMLQRKCIESHFHTLYFTQNVEMELSSVKPYGINYLSLWVDQSQLFKQYSWQHMSRGLH